MLLCPDDHLAGVQLVLSEDVFLITAMLAEGISCLLCIFFPDFFQPLYLISKGRSSQVKYPCYLDYYQIVSSDSPSRDQCMIVSWLFGQAWHIPGTLVYSCICVSVNLFLWFPTLCFFREIASVRFFLICFLNILKIVNLKNCFVIGS